LGEPFAGRAVEKRTALYLDGELDDAEFVRRAFKVARGLGLGGPPEGLHYFQLPGPLSDRAVQNEVSAIVAKSKATFIVVDSLTMSTYGADPKDPQPMITVFKYLESLKGATLVIDHIGKPSPGANLSQMTQFGSAFKHHASRSQIQMIKAPGGGVALLHKKSNFSPLSEPINLVMKFENVTGSDQVRFDVVEASDESMAGLSDHLPAIEQVYSALAEFEDGSTPTFLCKQLGKSEKTVRNYLSSLRARGRVKPLDDGRWLANLYYSESADEEAVPNSQSPNTLGIGTGET
jgi:DNA-binding transcriptional ArsR family regulator